MINVLKTLYKTGQGHKITNLCAPLGGTPRSGGTPPIAARRDRAARRMGGGVPAPFSLPPSVTPFTVLADLGVKK